MRCAICCAVFGLLVSSGAVFPESRAGTRLSARRHVKIISVRWLAPPPPMFLPYYIPVPIPYSMPDPVPYPVWNFIQTSPTLGYVGSVSPAHPRLVFKNGTTYTVADYWRVKDQLHFITIEEGGTKSVPHTVPFGDLDVKRTTDTNTAEGFRFVLRDEPIEQWLEHRAQRAAAQHGKKKSIKK